MSNHDQLHRYLFENYAVRGELVTVSETYQQILNNHDYPAPVQKLLGELLVATSLLTATLKFDGDITVQLQGDGPLKLAVINGNNRQEMRGVARTQAPIADDSTLHQMIGNGVMVITISPTEGERYQALSAWKVKPWPNAWKPTSASPNSCQPACSSAPAKRKATPRRPACCCRCCRRRTATSMISIIWCN